MAVGIYILPSTEAQRIADDMRLASDEAAAMVAAVGKSAPALAILHDGAPFVVCGFIPINLTTNSAYAWMEWTPDIYDLPVQSTRLCVEVFATMRRQYSYIFGHCSYGQRPVRLLQRLGAKFSTDPQDGRPCYVIEGYHEQAA